MTRWMMAATLGLALAGCANLPQPESFTPTAPAGAALPLKARALVVIATDDLGRKLSYDGNHQNVDTTDIGDGLALERAARALASKAFATVATNKPAIRPQLLLRVTGKAVWNYRDSSFKVTCEIFATDGVGTPIGHFPGAYRSPPVIDMESSLTPIYGQCLRNPLNELLRAQGLADMIRTGFPEPDVAATNAYLRSQGFVISGQ